MELYVYNHNLELAGIIDTASSVIWHRRYYTFGDFEIHVPAGEIEIELIQKQYIITKPNAVEFGIIEYITIEQREDGDFIKAVGRFGSSLLARRIIFETTNLNTTVENAMRTLVYENAINPTIADRIIPNLELGDLNSFSETVSFQVTYRNLANTLKGLAETSGIGYRVIFDPVAKKFKFETYKALDRSIEQSINPRALFSNDYDNLLTSMYQTSDMEYSNVALVGGEGEGIDRKLVVVGSASGLDRYEVFVNAKEIQMEDDLTEPEYFAMLAQKGAESMLPKVENFEGNVIAEGNLNYKQDYDLGDIVTIENNKWNKRISVQITEITEVDDDNGFQVIPVFGIATQTLGESLSGLEDTSGSGGGSITVTPNRVIISDAEGKAIASDITSTELGYLDGVTSNIQTQLNSKQENITGAASTIVSSNLTANRALISDANGKVAVSAVTSTELGYLDGVTSSVQTQLNSKVNISAPLAQYDANGNYEGSSEGGLLNPSVVSNLSGGYIAYKYNGQWYKLRSGYADDADMLDGLHASDFAGSSHTHSYLPLSGGVVSGTVDINKLVISDLNNYTEAGLILKRSGNTDWKINMGYGELHFDNAGLTGYSTMGINPNTGNVGIGARPDSHKLFVNGHLRVEASNASGLDIRLDNYGTFSGATRPTIRPESDTYGFVGTSDKRWYRMYADGGFLTSSMREMKEDITPINKNEKYEMVKNLKLYDYNLKVEYENGLPKELHDLIKKKRGNEKSNIGIIVDEAPKVLIDEDETSVNLYNYTSLAISALQGLMDKVESLEKEIAALKGV